MKTAFAVALLSLASGCFLFPAHAERATTPPDGLLVDTSPVQREHVAEARVEVAVARLDLAKVVAVNTLARPDLQKPDASVFAAEVRQAEAREEVALAGLVAAEREVSVCRDLLTERQAGQ